MHHVLFFSGGVASAVGAFRLAEKHPPNKLTFLFCDTKMEDEDLYRFNADVEKKLGIKITTIADGRDVWQIYFDERLLGNSQKDPCSKILKRELSTRWIKKRFQPEDVTLHLGMYWDEQDRLQRVRERWAPYPVDSPLLWKPCMGELSARDFLKKQGIKLPRLYGMGFLHNNCGGFCCKAGKGHFRLLLRKMPERFAYHEKREQEIREFLKRDVSILNDTDKNGNKTRLTLREFRERVEAEPKGFFNIDEGGETGCGCFAGEK